MSFFARKKQSKQSPKLVVDDVYTEQYREELRQQGRDYFQKILDANATTLTKDIDSMTEQLAGALKRHLASQLDVIIRRVNTEISNGMKDQMSEYARVSREAQELVTQSLSQAADSAREKYQQLETNLQQVASNQEMEMTHAFQDNQARVATLRAEQEALLEQLRSSVEEATRQTDELRQAMKSDISQQSQLLKAVYQENATSADELKREQVVAVESLRQTVTALEAQRGTLQQLITSAIARQKALAAEMIDENMSRIVEHYLVSALGERSSLVKDLPDILKRMDENKRDMIEDMKQ